MHSAQVVFRKTTSTLCTALYSSVQPCTPVDGHSGARNMLSHLFINKS